MFYIHLDELTFKKVCQCFTLLLLGLDFTVDSDHLKAGELLLKCGLQTGVVSVNIQIPSVPTPNRMWLVT